MNPYGMIIPAGLAITLVIIAMVRGGREEVGRGFGEAGGLFLTVLPNLVIGFTLAGFISILLPQDMVVKWIGADSGFAGLLVGTAAGSLTPGGPFTHFPILASLISKGAAIGPISAYIAAWALIGVHRILIWEGPVLGWSFVAVRFASCFFAPIMIGAISGFIASFFPETFQSK